MKRIIGGFLAAVLLLGATVNAFVGTTASEDAEKQDDFIADFSSADGWTGLTCYLGFQQNKFGNNDGWNNQAGSIVSKESYSFGNCFDVHFSLYTDYRNGNSNGVHEDFYVTVGNFKIAVCDFQTRIQLYYNDIAVAGETADADLKYCSVRNYNYDVHIEPGNITITSDLLKYSSTFSDFEAQDHATVSVTLNETWHIYTCYFSSLSVDHISTEERDSSFTADFSSAEQWIGLTDYLGYEDTKFGTNAGWNNVKGTLSTVKFYDFGEEFNINFSLYTNYRNGNKNGVNEDFYITVGDFKLAVCDFQTRMTLSYRGENIPLTGESGADYTPIRDYRYEIHIEKGNITLTSDLLSYTSDFAEFDPVDIAKVSITINEDWHIWKEYFGNLFVGKLIEAPRATEFRADFSADTQWEGLTEYLAYEEDKYGNRLGWNNQTGTLITKEKFDFGSAVDASFRLFTNYHNKKENGTNEDFYITIGNFKIALCDFQTRVEVYYKGICLEGTTEEADLTYLDTRDYSYSVHLEKGNITVDSDLVHYSSSFDDFETVDKANVAITINETWQIHNYAFSELLVNIQPEVEVKVYEQCGSKLVSLFKEDDVWDGEMMQLIDTESGYFPSDTGWNNTTGVLTSKGVYDFSDSFYLFTALKTSGINNGYKTDSNANRTHTDYSITVGKFRLDIRAAQNGMALYYADKMLAEVYQPEYDYSRKEYTYSIVFKPGEITVEQCFENETVLKLQSDFSDYEPVNQALVSIGICEDWQINAGCFDYLIVAAAGENITSADDFFKQLEHDRFDWSAAAYGGTSIESDFTNAALWTDSLASFIDTDAGCLAVEKGWENTTGKLTSAQWYSFGEAFLCRFRLYTTYFNDAAKKSPEDNLDFAEYKINIGDFTLEICYFQNRLALYYRDTLIAEKQADQLTYDTKDYSYVLRVSKGDIVLRQMNGPETVMELVSSFRDFEPVSQGRVSIEILETWQIYDARFSSLSVEAQEAYNVLYSFHAQTDIAAVLEQKDIPSAWIKSQWSLLQRYKDGLQLTEWQADTVEKKLHITGFYNEIPIEPAPIPMLHITRGDYTSQIGIYENSLILRTNFSDSHARTTALCFEAPADGRIRLYDPEYGLVSVVSTLNGQKTWCMNGSDTDVKSATVAIYKNEEKVWPLDSDGYLIGNATHPELANAVTDFPFPDLLLEVKRGDKIYFAVTPKHYQLASGKILSNNPTLLSLNPQIDYVRLDSELVLNTNREITVAKKDPNIAASVTAKSAVIHTEDTFRISVLVAGIAAAAVLGVLATVTVVVICKKRRKTEVAS